MDKIKKINERTELKNLINERHGRMVINDSDRCLKNN